MRHLLASEGVEALVGVPDKRKTHLSRRALVELLLRRLGQARRRSVVLLDLIGGEVGDVDIGGQLRLKRRTDTAELGAEDATEEGVRFDLLSTATAQTIGRVTDQAMSPSQLKFSRPESAATDLRTRCSASAPSLISSGK